MKEFIINDTTHVLYEDGSIWTGQNAISSDEMDKLIAAREEVMGKVWHNPESVPFNKLSYGWRFLTEREVGKNCHASKNIQAWRADHWIRDICFKGNDKNITYQTNQPLLFNQTPIVAPQPHNSTQDTPKPSEGQGQAPAREGLLNHPICTEPLPQENYPHGYGLSFVHERMVESMVKSYPNIIRKIEKAGVSKFLRSCRFVTCQSPFAGDNPLDTTYPWTFEFGQCKDGQLTGDGNIECFNGEIKSLRVIYSIIPTKLP